MLSFKDKYFTIEEYAELKKITPWYVRKLCRIGKIKAEKIGRVWFIKRKKVIIR